ncbi:MAG: hypothetical protein GX202_02485, partial [Firmicutes bacterium]|nr:hypothetical protein [Bacillota bacterium]
MTVAAGLGERTDQAFFALTGTTQAAGSQGRVSGKETEGSEFQQLFEGLVKEEEEMAEERLPKNTVVDEDILSQLILLYPELSAMTSAQISTMFSLDQETTPLPLAQEPISFPSDRKPDPWSLGLSVEQEATAVSVDQEATAMSVDQEATAMSVGQEPNPFSLDQGLIAGGEAGKELPNAVQTGGGDWPTLNAANEAFVTAMTAGPAEAGLAVARLAEAGPAEVRGVEATATNGNTAVDHETLTGTLPAPEVTMAVQENEESSVIQTRWQALRYLQPQVQENEESSVIQTKVAVVADEIEAG